MRVPPGGCSSAPPRYSQADVRTEAILIWSNCSWIWWKETIPGTSAPEQGDLMLGYSCTGRDPGAAGAAQSFTVLQTGRRGRLCSWNKSQLPHFVRLTVTLTPVTNSQHQHQKQTNHLFCSFQITPLCLNQVQLWFTNDSTVHWKDTTEMYILWGSRVECHLRQEENSYSFNLISPFLEIGQQRQAGVVSQSQLQQSHPCTLNIFSACWWEFCFLGTPF